MEKVDLYGGGGATQPLPKTPPTLIEEIPKDDLIHLKKELETPFNPLDHEQTK